MASSVEWCVHPYAQYVLRRVGLDKTRPKHEDAMEEYLNDHWAPLKTAIDNESLDEFMKVMDEAVDAANAWHEKKDKGYIRWKVPSEPPPDIDFEPRK